MATQDLLDPEVLVELERWFREEFTPEFHKRYDSRDEETGETIPASLYLALLDDAEPKDWRDPLAHILIEFCIGAYNKIFGLQGLKENVVRKLRFSVRTRLPSGDAKRNRHLIRRGDFPYAGADKDGGASGVTEEGDYWCLQQVRDKLNQLQTAAAGRALAACDLRATQEDKYLEGTYS